MSEVNTVCSSCYFFQDSNCLFNIPLLISKEYPVEETDNNIVIKNYKCSYAFSQKQFDKHKDDLPKDFMEYVRSSNSIKYYMIINVIHKNCDEVIKIYDKYIDTLSIKPYEISLACTLEKDGIVELIESMKTRNQIKWKLHNFVDDSSNANDFNILNTITGTNISADKKGFLCYFDKDFEEIQEQINYANFIATVKKTHTISGLRQELNSFNGLFLPIEIFKSFKNIHEEGEKPGTHYLEVLKTDTTIIKPYYE